MQSTIRRLSSATVTLGALLVAGTASAQVNCNENLSPLDTAAQSRIGVVDFIRDVAAKEVEFSKAFLRYTYTLEVTVQTLHDGTVDGEFHQVSDIGFDATGNRHETVTGGPSNTLTHAQLGNRDVESLRDAFTLTPALLASRDIVYSGRQEVGEFNTAAFDILPRNGQAGTRTFLGRVWVRASQNAIIRSCGRVNSGPFGPLRYLVERTRVDDGFWFPGTIRADEDATVDDSQVHIRVTVKYTNYKTR